MQIKPKFNQAVRGTRRDSKKAAKALKEGGAGTVMYSVAMEPTEMFPKGFGPDIPLYHSL
ncbi:MAG: hypothetical protein Ct9H90mP30_7030 [Actinomycetota bacterium]|nr:MAG: hypothetical protein Ct9H90mP30_7030 [Actinomycetota bacterium]